MDDRYTPAPLVGIGNFFGDDILPDAILVNFRHEFDYGAYTRVEFMILRNNGASLDYTKAWSYRRKAYPDELDIRMNRGKVLHANGFVFLQDENPTGTYIFNSSHNLGNRLFHEASKIWVADLDNDPEVELGIVDYSAPIEVWELEAEFTRQKSFNGKATSEISQAAKDFGINLFTDDAVDFQNLWVEHGPSASVAALALILDVPFHDLLYYLYRAADQGEEFRDVILRIHQSN